jgi:hypothetical protein
VPKADPRVVVKLFCMAETSTVYSVQASSSKEGIVIIVHTPAKGKSGLALWMA